jgi:tetratricopeptide (TPR) repeat protein
MYKSAALLVTCVLLGGFTITTTSVAQAKPLEIQPNSDELKQLLEEGQTLVNAGNYNEAINTYQRAANLDPRNPKIYSGIAYLYAEQKQFQSALLFYRRAIALDPDNSDFYYAVGYVKGNLGNISGAKEAYRKSIQLNRSNLNAYLGLAVTQAALGDYSSAMWAYNRAIDLNKDYPPTYELMGKMFEQRHLTKQANTILQKALNLYRQSNDIEGINRVEGLLQRLGG